MDEMGFSENMSDTEILRRLLQLASTRLAQNDKNLGQIAINPDYRRKKHWNNYFKMMGFIDNKNKIINNPIIDIYMDNLDIEGKTLGIFGNNAIESQSELSRLSMGMSLNKDVDKTKDAIDIGYGIKIKSGIVEKSVNIEKSEKEKLKLEQEKTDREKQLQIERDKLINDLENEKTRQMIIINTQTSAEQNDKNNKKNKSKKDNKVDRLFGENKNDKKDLKELEN